MEFDDLSHQVIGCALEVHRNLGPGLLESAYEQCLAHELSSADIQFKLQQPIPVRYKSIVLDCGFRADFIIGEAVAKDNAAGRLIVELKSIERLLPIHEAQLLTYMRLTNIRIGLLINFNVTILKDGIKRMVL